MATREVGNLRTKLSWEDDGAHRSLEGFKRDLRGLRSEMKVARSGGREYTQSLRGMREQSDILTRRLRTQREQVQELRRRYEESRRTKGDAATQTQNLANQYRNATAQMNMTEEQLKRLNDEIRRQESPWTRLGENLTNAGDRMQQFGRGMSRVGRSMTMRVTTPIVGMGTAALMAGMNFEEGMSKVQAISGATGDELQMLEDQARELGGTTRFSATEAAGAMEYLAMAGFEVNEITESMPGLLDLAAAANMDLARAADITSNIISGFGYEAEDAGRVADVLAEGAASANTSVEQLGDAMATVAPVASALDLEVEGLTAAVGFMSDAGIQGSTAGRQLRQGLLRLSDPTGEAADLIEDLGINVFDADGNMKDLDEVVNELAGGLDGMSAQAETAALSTLFGSQSVAGWTALLERGGDELADYTGELENSEGAASDMAKTMQDNAKGAMIEFQSALEGVGIEIAQHIIPAFTDAVEWTTDLVRKFGELDEEQQKQILKWMGIAAAAGPAAMVLGNVFTVVGGVARVAGGLATTLGRVGGSGLLGRIAMMGPGAATPVGLAIAGVGLLSGVVYALSRDKEELNEINWDVVEGMREEVEATDELIDSFVELEDKNRLSREEMMRYMDIMDQLKQTDSPQEIERLTEEQENLLEASGLTNEEMNEFLGLNDEIIEKAPETAGAISEEGNAYAENLDKLKALNEEKRQEMLITAERELMNALENEAQLYQDQRDLVSEIREINDDISENRNNMVETVRTLQEEEDKLRGIQEQILELEGDTSLEARNKREQLERQRTEQSGIVEGLRAEKDGLDETYNQLVDKLQVKNDDLEVTREELREMDKLQGEYESLILAQADITAERGHGLVAIDEELGKLDEAKQKLEEQRQSGELTTGEYQNMNSELSTQRQRLILARDQLENINDLAGQTVYDKNIHLRTNPSIAELDRRLGESVTKNLNVSITGATGSAGIAYAKGTDNHPGGPFIAGEEGWELGRLGNKLEVLNAGLYDRPRGYQVFPHNESKKILNAMNNMPGYQDGARPMGEANRIIDSINSNERAFNQTINIYSPEPTSPAENARRIKQASRQLAMEGRW